MREKLNLLLITVIFCIHAAFGNIIICFFLPIGNKKYICAAIWKFARNIYIILFRTCSFILAPLYTLFII